MHAGCGGMRRRRGGRARAILLGRRGLLYHVDLLDLLRLFATGQQAVWGKVAVSYGRYEYHLAGRAAGQLPHPSNSAAPPSATYRITWARDGANLSSVPSLGLEKREAS